MTTSNSLPPTMLALTAPSYTTPSNFELSNIPTPTISTPTGIIIKVHAAAINHIDTLKADGSLRRFQCATFPMRIGLDVSGTVIAIGTSVSNFKPGDEVYALLSDEDRGSAAEYVHTQEEYVAKKPETLTHIEAASLVSVAVCTLQSLERAAELLEGGLEGKTVLIPAGLSGTGSMACQLAKRAFGAARVITTVSTSKIPKVAELLGEDTVDHIIDYTTQDVVKEVGEGVVDVMIDTQKQSMVLLPVMKPDTGTIISLSMIPSGTKAAEEWKEMPRAFAWGLDSVDKYYRWKTGRKGVHYEYWFAKRNGESLEKVRQLVESGKLRPVVGRVEELSDLNRVRDGCAEIHGRKGGIGKFVIEVARSS